ncbi:hypothetical protein IMX07_03140 [bacterium]|nr:hypothetical protein [bacterium]
MPENLQIPSAQEFLEKLPNGHLGKRYGRNAAFLRDLDSFLRLWNLAGFEEKKREFECVGRNQIKWYSLCAELRAIVKIAEKLSLRIRGFNQVPPRQRIHKFPKDCDISAEIGGSEFFFEVKAKSAETSQLPAEHFREFLETLPWSRRVSIRRARSTSRTAWDATIQRLNEHVSKFESPIVPPPYSDELVKVSFSPRPGKKFTVTSMQPDEVEDIKKWLFGDLTDPKKIPIVKQAVSKGADFLVAQVPGWFEFSLLFDSIFSDISRIQNNFYLTSDQNINSLCGILFISASNKFALVYNRSFHIFPRVI